MVNHPAGRVNPDAGSYNGGGFPTAPGRGGAQKGSLMDLFIGLLIGVVLTLFLVGVVVFARAGSLGRASWGLTVAGRANIDPGFAAKVNELMGLPAAPGLAPPAAPKAPVKPSGAPIRILTLLQAESRFIDFLLEDISAFPDAQVGQAVREIHRKAQAALRQHLALEPVVPASEGETVTVPKGFDPSAIRVLGNVTGEPPFTGQVQHPGWRVREIRLAPPPAGQDEFVIQPAEVQLP